jgi:hypothetical protein
MVQSPTQPHSLDPVASDPFVWIHIADIIILPLWLALTVLGLATADPVLPPGLERLFLGLAGVAPVAVMQFKKPFYLFSLVAVVLPPAELTVTRRRILAVFQSWEYRWVILPVTIVLMLFIGERLYDVAPFFRTISPLHESGQGSRLTGLILAGAAFCAANLFVQIPAAAALALFFPQSKWLALEPVISIEDHFTLVGKPVAHLLAQWTPQEPQPDLSSENPEQEELSDHSIEADKTLSPAVNLEGSLNSPEKPESPEADLEPEANSVES